MSADRQMTRNDKGSSPQSPDTQLDIGALSFVEVLMQGVTHIAPAFGLFFSMQFIASLAGVTAPLGYAVGATIMVFIAASLGSMAKHIPSAGGYFTYVSRAVGPRVGFFISWLYVLYSPITAGLVFGIVGVISNGYFEAEYGFAIAWYWWVLVGLVFCAIVSHRGIKIAGRLLLITGIAEMAILFALALSGLASPGKGGLNFESFNPANSLSGNGFYLAIVFSIVAYTGWESIGPLAEETANPRRAVPKAMVLSIVVMALYWCIVSWGILIGWGTDNIVGFGSSETNPILSVGSDLWGSASILILVALWNSALAVGLALFNVTTRMWFGMAKSGVLPQQLTRLHPKYKTPTYTIAITLVINILVAIVLGAILGADQAFFFYSYFLSFALVFIYGAGNLAVFMFFRKEQRAEFNPFLHTVVPVVTTVALVFVQYKASLPLPAEPIRYGLIVFAGWFLLGLVALLVMRVRGREDWLLKAGMAAELGAEDTSSRSSAA